ncbi:MAG: amylo-alpha-1,6-glucosidase [Rikenellaceae bacterium]
MAILKFDKNELTNLEYSLDREFISTNRAGGYMSTTITCCNTRKYHGLMVCPIENLGSENYVLLSSLDETIIQRGESFNLAIHGFPAGVYEPKGHKYIRSFDYTPTPTLVYRVGGVVLKKELLWLHSKDQLLIRYTLEQATSPTTLRLRPFLAFRQTHTLSKENMNADGRSYKINGGVKNRLYENLPYLHMQLNCESEFYPAPEWYKDFEYIEEIKRGYESREDLLTTGVFDIDFTNNPSVVISCSLSEVDTTNLNELFEEELSHRTEKVEFLPCLKHSGRQFVVKQDGEMKFIAGYPWFERQGRDTFIAAPWVTLSQDKADDCMGIFKSSMSHMSGGLFRAYIGNYESADTSLWFYNALQQLEKAVGEQEIWNNFGKVMMELIETYASGLSYMGVELRENGLIWASKEGVALTWMNKFADGKPVTQRGGYVIEINAMWYNAICYTLELAKKHGENSFIEKWQSYPELIKESFHKVFWLENENYFADFVNDREINKQIRPNQIFACALPYRVAEDDEVKAVIDIIDQHLLTNKGLRTLSPKDSEYIGFFGGNERERALGHHQGTTRAWLLPYYYAANYSIYENSFNYKAEQLILGFEEDFLDYGVGTMPELYDGNPPHKSGGAVSKATSVGAMLKLIDMIDSRK